MVGPKVQQETRITIMRKIVIVVMMILITLLQAPRFSAKQAHGQYKRAGGVTMREQGTLRCNFFQEPICNSYFLLSFVYQYVAKMFSLVVIFGGQLLNG